jgi:hypothetical protein
MVSLTHIFPHLQSRQYISGDRRSRSLDGAKHTADFCGEILLWSYLWLRWNNSIWICLDLYLLLWQVVQSMFQSADYWMYMIMALCAGGGPNILARCAILHLNKDLCGPVSWILWGLKGYLIFGKFEWPGSVGGYVISMVNCAMCYLVYAVQSFCSVGPDYECVSHITEQAGGTASR